VVEAQMSADSLQCPVEVVAVEVDGVVNSAGREATAAHRHVLPPENAADRSPSDAEPITQLIHRGAGTDSQLATAGFDRR
jgi:hypothetical protein